MSITIKSKIVQRVVTIDGNTSVLDAAKIMAEEFNRSLVVTNASKIQEQPK